jgi:hypothetical protein
MAAFRRMIEIAHAHGIDVTAGIWDHVYRGGVQAGGIEGASERADKPSEGLVWGVNGREPGAVQQSGAAQVPGGLSGNRCRSVQNAPGVGA